MRFVVAITTFNRLQYLKNCIKSWNNTRSKDQLWTLIVADDGSIDGTSEYLDQLEILKTEIIILKNNRIGIHQQANTILAELSKINFDLCFKVDDDIEFKEAGWDIIYYQTAIESGFHHLVYCDEKWSKDQLKSRPVKNGKLIGKLDLLNIQGHFYTISPQILKQVGYFDVENFGFRGMGHVDYTARCARAGFSDIENPWDVINSDKYFVSVNKDYKSALPLSQITAYDELNRDFKIRIIKQENRIFIPSKPIDKNLYDRFKDDLLVALTIKVKNAEAEKNKLDKWYHVELEKTEMWYQNKINNLPNWYISLGNKIFKK